jgi:hypothetical protein
VPADVDAPGQTAPEKEDGEEDERLDKALKAGIPASDPARRVAQASGEMIA